MPTHSGDTPSRAATPESTLPAARNFSVPHPSAPTRANAEIIRDFLDLSFELESGRALPRLTRFEGPITLRLTGAPTVGMQADLAQLIYRLRKEAGINITQVGSGAANITVQAIPRAEIRRHLPRAACFVVPNISDVRDYASARAAGKTNWAALTRRERMAVFVPSDASPQEARDCLHEEIAQALGPLNDLYRLPDSVFNDDNVHTVLTGFDMTILRAYYDPALKNGMSRTDVARRLPAILARVNPAGQRIAARPLPRTPRAWISAVQTALGPGVSSPQREAAARRALQIASAQGWQDHRRAFSHYAMGRVMQPTNPARARDEFILADQFYRRSPATRLHRAYVASQLAAYSVSAGQGDQALSLIGGHLDAAARGENAALLSTLLLLRAEALDLSGRSSEARSVRLDSLGWARYGFGADWAVQAKLREISALSPLKR